MAPDPVFTIIGDSCCPTLDFGDYVWYIVNFVNWYSYCVLKCYVVTFWLTYVEVYPEDDQACPRAQTCQSNSPEPRMIKFELWNMKNNMKDIYLFYFISVMWCFSLLYCDGCFWYYVQHCWSQIMNISTLCTCKTSMVPIWCTRCAFRQIMSLQWY
jgi:hypothetical protein